MSMVPKEAMGAILAALIAGLVSLLGLIISKEQKVSEFRQAWIDGLRENVALIITHIEALRGALYAVRPAVLDWEKRKEYFIAINQSITCVRLRLDPTDDDAQKLLTSLGALERVVEGGSIGTSPQIGPAVDDLTEKCRQLMQAEWARVREGEATYRAVRYASLATICIALLALSFIIGRSLSSTPVDTPQAAQSNVRIVVPPCSNVLNTRSDSPAKTPNPPDAQR